MYKISDTPRLIVDKWVADGIIKGGSLLVAHNGRTVLKRHAGLAKFSGVAEPVNDDTLFMIASITKTMTAACFMHYVERGIICLSDPVSAHIPDFSRNGKTRVTFLHLLTHTSGLPEQVEGKDELRVGGGGMEIFLERIYAAKTLFAPGEGYQYSNCGFALLARTVELIEKRPFGEALRDRIFAPLGMSNSALGFDESWDPR